MSVFGVITGTGVGATYLQLANAGQGEGMGIHDEGLGCSKPEAWEVTHADALSGSRNILPNPFEGWGG